MHHDITIGTKLEHFEIVGRLGSGGAGAVFKAKNLNDGKLVALKSLTAATVINEEIHKRFIREISVAQKLQHPNIVAYDYCGFDENVLYYTMELVPWGTLGEVLHRKQRLPWRQAAECAIDICHALGYLHYSNIVHRDLKPANIFLSDDGRLKLGDFGLVRDLDSERLTNDGFTVGTAKYLAPEQAMAKVHIDGRADLYALGCLLFEMVAGRPPFMSDNASSAVNFHELMGKHVKEKPSLVSAFIPGCPERLVTLIDQLLAKKPDERPTSAAVVAETLQSILNESPSESSATFDATTSEGEEPIESVPKTLTSRLMEDRVSEKKVNYPALAVILVLAIVGVVVAVVRSQS